MQCNSDASLLNSNKRSHPFQALLLCDLYFDIEALVSFDFPSTVLVNTKYDAPKARRQIEVDREVTPRRLGYGSMS